MCRKIHITDPAIYPLRCSLMNSIGQMLQPEFEQQLHSSNYLNSEKMRFGLFKNKLEGRPLRAFFVNKLYAYISDGRPIPSSSDSVQLSPSNDEKWKEEHFQQHFFFTRQLPLVVEAIITIQYYSNQIYDNKGEVMNDKASIDNNIKLMENLTPTLYHYIWSNYTPKEMKCKAMMTVMEILRLGAVGQVIEDDCNTYEAWLNDKVLNPLTAEPEGFFDQEVLDFLIETVRRRVDFPENKIAFLEMYFKKIYLRNAALYGLMTELILDYCEVKSEQCEKLKKFATLFAIMHQLVNDIGDLVPSNRDLSTMEKTNKDAFSDLRNNTLTLPIMLHLLVEPNGLMEMILKNKISQLDNIVEENLLIDAAQQHSIFTAMSIGKDIQKKAVSYLDPANEHFKLLADMCRIAENNKYYKHFYDREQDYKAYRRKTRRFRLQQTLSTEKNDISNGSVMLAEQECV